MGALGNSKFYLRELETKIDYAIFADDTCLDIYDANIIQPQLTQYVKTPEPRKFTVQWVKVNIPVKEIR